MKVASQIFSTLIFILTSSAQAGPVGDWGGRVLRWNLTAASAPLTTYNTATAAANATLVTAVSNALTTWQNAGTSYISFTPGGAGSNITIDIPASLSNSFAAAQAIPSIDANGNISSCTVQVGPNYLASASATDIQAAVTHEIGHCLGLAHSINTGAVMSYRGGSVNLTNDDLLAISQLYPSSGPNTYPLGCATVQTGTDGGTRPPGPGSTIWLALGFLWFSWGIARRSRPKRGIGLRGLRRYT